MASGQSSVFLMFVIRWRCGDSPNDCPRRTISGLAEIVTLVQRASPARPRTVTLVFLQNPAEYRRRARREHHRMGAIYDVATRTRRLGTLSHGESLTLSKDSVRFPERLASLPGSFDRPKLEATRASLRCRSRLAQPYPVSTSSRCKVAATARRGADLADVGRQGASSPHPLTVRCR